MKQLFYTSLCFCLSILLSSCQNDPTEVDQAENNLPSTLSTTNISIDDALKHLDRHLSYADTRSSIHTYNPNTVSVVYMSDLAPATRGGSSTDNALAYIVPFEEGGFALLGADPRIASIVMVAPEGELSVHSLVEAQAKVNQGKEYSTYEYFNALAANYLLTATEEPIEEIQPIIVGPTSDWYVIQNLSPFMKTHWNQLMDPYNNYCPVIEDAIVQPARYAVGCGAIALAQILVYNHWKHNVGFTEFPGAFEDPEYTLSFPHTPNWTLLDIAAAQETCYTLSTDIQDEVARFIFATAVNIGTTYEPYYNHAGATVMDYVEIFMKKLSSYKNIRIVGHHETIPSFDDSNLVFWEELEKLVYHCHYPIIMCGDPVDESAGHFWVVDGWVKEAQDLSFGARYIRSYVYCNFGYGQDDYYCTTGLFGTGEDNAPNYCENLAFLYYTL